MGLMGIMEPRGRKILLRGRFISRLCMRMMIFMGRRQVFFAGRFIASLGMVMFFMRRWKILLTGWLIPRFAVMVRWWWRQVFLAGWMVVRQWMVVRVMMMLWRNIIRCGWKIGFAGSLVARH